MEGTDRRPRIALPLRPEGTDRCYSNYFRAVTAACGEPANLWDDCDPSPFDGLVLPGGGDVEPWRYGQENRGSCAMDADLDAHQLAALDAFVKAGKPVLGICRGHQLINIYFGGTLVQDIPTKADHRSTADGDSVNATHAAPGSFLSRLYGGDFPVNSSHHQAVDAPGEGLEMVQWASDGVVEGLRHRTLPVFGVQWHPERMCLAHARADTVDGLRVFAWFLALCAGDPDPFHPIDHR